MAEKYMFFDSETTDKRVYKAKDFVHYFETMLTTGVFGEQLDSLQVRGHGSELKTIVPSGRAFIDGYLYENDADLELEHSLPDPVQNRIDRVVIRLDTTRENRYIKAFVIQGIPGGEPPELTRNDDIFEISLAQVFIPAGKSFIEDEQMTDERANEILCGYVRYQAKPAWYPGGDIPQDAWIYVNYPDELTEQEKQDIENTPSLMEIINKPHSLKTQLADKVNKIEGKQLSTEDYTTEEKAKLEGIENEANHYIHPGKHLATIIIQNSTHRFVDDSEKNNWNEALDKANNNETQLEQIPNDYEPKITTKRSGFNLNKSDSITSTSSSTLATSKAVRTAYYELLSVIADNVVSGTYTGNGSYSTSTIKYKTINVGFTPSAVLVIRNGRIYTKDSYYGTTHGGLAVYGNSAIGVEIVTNGFKVTNDTTGSAKIYLNEDGEVYNYICIV